MRDKNIYSLTRALPRMSWSPTNLYNLYQRSLGPSSGSDQTSFRRTFLSLFQQRWRSKRLVRAYHGDHIGEKKFKRWFLPEFIPTPSPSSSGSVGGLRLAGRTLDALDKERKAKEKQEQLARSPVGSLMFVEVERRMDTVLFRSCFAESVYKARQMILHGRVKLNGVKVSLVVCVLIRLIDWG